ncbi:MAG: pyrroline-5-carboxylate reductase [archaeon]
MIIDKKLGMIGMGHFGEALVRALLDKDVFGAENIIVSDADDKKLSILSEELGFVAAKSNREAARTSDIIVTAVKPQVIGAVLDEIRVDSAKKLLISPAAGVLTGYMEGKAPGTRVIRTMTNMGIRIGLGATAYTLGKTANGEDAQLFEKMFSRLGICHKVDESQLDMITGMAGNGPAYIYLITDSLAQSAVNAGMDRETAVEFACQTVKAAATLIEESGEDPAKLINDVATPGGTTVEGLKVLDKYKVREAFVRCVEAATKRSKEFNIQGD